MQTEFLLAFIAYFAILLTIGLLAHRKSRSEADFVMGGRSLNFWLTALSAHASDMSAWLFMAVPAAVYLGGLSELWIAIGLWVGMWVCWQWIAPALRSMTEELGCYTLSSFFGKRFEDESGAIRFVTACLTLLFMTNYLSAGLIAMGKLLELLFQIDYYVGITVAVVVAVIYTSVGGFTTIAWTDSYQGIFLLTMILLVPLLAWSGLDPKAVEAEWESLHFLEGFLEGGVLYNLLLAFGWGIGYLGMPHVLTKFMGIKSVGEIRKAKYFGLTWQFLALLGATSVGLVGLPYFAEPPANSELIFSEMVLGLLPTFFAGFVMCGVIAANMSTMDSQILVCATVIGEDLYRHFVGEKAAAKQRLWISRMGVLATAALALFLAYLGANSTVMATVQYSWAGLGCVFAPLVVTAIYDPKANRNGALAGAVAGGVVALFWSKDATLAATILGFPLGVATIYSVSRLLPVAR